MFKVKRALIMAAGRGSRMNPITLDTPKSLVRVNGVRIIDTVIHALHQNGITEIYVVVGYLKEQFQQLLSDYPDLILVENPHYATCNNISSLYVVRDYLEDAMILDADQLIKNPAVLEPCFERSCYNALWTDTPTDEWLLTVANGIITQCSSTGGEHGWQLFSVSRWSPEDGRRLRCYLEIEFEQKRNYQIFWDDVTLLCYPQAFQLGIHPMKRGDIIALDTLRELAAIDSSYQPYLNGGHENDQGDIG